MGCDGSFIKGSVLSNSLFAISGKSKCQRRVICCNPRRKGDDSKSELVVGKMEVEVVDRKVLL